jgi:hypothetical protein
LQPATVDAAAAEAADWNGISNSRNSSDFEGFIKKYPSSARSSLARKKLEDIDWAAVDTKSRSSLQSFLNKYPQGTHAAEGQKLLSDLAKVDATRQDDADWNSVDKKNRTSIQSYLAAHPVGKHVQEAHQLDDQLKADQIAQARQAERSAWNAVDKNNASALADFIRRYPSGEYLDQAKHALDAADGRKIAARRDSEMILSAISRYANAWSKKDLDTIVSLRPGLERRTIKNQLANAKSIELSIRPLSDPAISGDTATVNCTQILRQTFSDKQFSMPPTAATVTLSRHGGSWTIDDIRIQ